MSFVQRFFLGGVFSFFCGVAAASLGEFLTGVWIFFVGLGFARVLRFSLREALIFCLVFGIGFFRFSISHSLFESAEVFEVLDQPVVFSGRVDEYPDVRADVIKLRIALEEVDGRSIHGNVLVSLARYPDSYVYGQHIEFKGMLERPAVFEDFSYEDYLRRYGVHAVSYTPRVVSAPLKEKGLGFYDVLFRLKSFLEERLNRLFVEPHASLAAGLLLGSRRGIPEDVMEDFNASGLTHLVAISGYNITLIVVFVGGLLSGFSRRMQIILTMSAIVLFVILVGASAAVVRAALMGILGLSARWLGRPSEVTRLLFGAALLMILYNPFVLLDDVGFQLSFSATCGLVYTTTYVQRFLEWARVYQKLPGVFSIREALLSTLSAQTFSTPLILFYFGRFSWVSPLANVLAAMMVPLAMLFSALALVVSLFDFSAGVFVAYGAWFFIESILNIAHFINPDWAVRLFSFASFAV